MRVWTILAAFILLAGCSSTGSKVAPSTGDSKPTTTRDLPPGLPPTINATTDLFALHPELTDCVMYGAVMQLPENDVKAVLPPEYDPIGLGSPALASVNLILLQCQSFVLDNETVIPSVELAFVEARVSVNESLGAGAEYQWYLLELIVSNQTAHALFTALGFHALLGEVVLQSGDVSTQAQIRSDGTLYYDVAGGNGAGDGVERTFGDRLHQLVSNDSAQWINHNQTYTVPFTPGPAVVQVHDGILMKIQPGSEGVHDALGQLGPSRSQLGFGKL